MKSDICPGISNARPIAIIKAVECNNNWHKFSPLVYNKYALCVDLIKFYSL